MNRELKLSLIMGFALVLAVGVLISDHFSTARGPGSASPDVMADSALHGSFGSGPESLASKPLGGTWADDIAKKGAELGSDIAAVAHRGSEAVSDAFNDWQEDAKGTPLALQTDPAPPLNSPEPRADPEPDPAAAEPERPRFPEVFVNDGKRKLDGSDTPWGSQPENSAGADPRTYVVDADDTLWGIAQEFYGDGALYKELARHNAGRIGADFSVRKGSRIILPDPAALGAPPRTTPRDTPADPPAKAEDGRPGSKPETKPETKPQGKPEAKPDPKSTPSRTYIVQKNDTLSQIAQRELGTVKRMNEILALNSDKIDSADDIWVGLKLKLPKT